MECDYKVDTVLSYDEEKVKEFANSINDQVKVDAIDAKISISGSNISITSGGYKERKMSM